MTVTKIYPDCDLFNGKNAYWVSCPEKLIDPILAIVGQAERTKFESYGRESHLSNRFADRNPELAEPGCYYFLVAEDCSVAIPMAPYYPYSGQWNGYNPFFKTREVTAETIKDLKKEMAKLSSECKNPKGSKFIGTEDEFIITHPAKPD